MSIELLGKIDAFLAESWTDAARKVSLAVRRGLSKTNTISSVKYKNYPDLDVEENLNNYGYKQHQIVKYHKHHPTKQGNTVVYKNIESKYKYPDIYVHTDKDNKIIGLSKIHKGKTYHSTASKYIDVIHT